MEMIKRYAEKNVKNNAQLYLGLIKPEVQDEYYG